MATITFDADDFREQFPNQFDNPPNTDAILELYWDTATCYVSCEVVSCDPLSAECRQDVINLVTAHLITIADAATLGLQSGFVESATEDKISVTMQSFDSQTQFQWFLNQTPYGQQAYALLYVQGAGGTYHGGFGELAAFRRAGGAFIPSS